MSNTIIGKKKTTEVLLNGLYALEYRGYDSAGVAISDGKNLLFFSFLYNL